MKKLQPLPPQRASASAFVWRARSHSIPFSLAAVFASALTASADLDSGNLVALNNFTMLEDHGENATKVYGNLASIFNTPISQITSMTPTQLAASINAGLASGAGINFGLGGNPLSGAQQISGANAAALQSAYNANHNKAELIANLYGSMGVNLAQYFSSQLLPTTPTTPHTPPTLPATPATPATPIAKAAPSSPTVETTFDILHDRVFDQTQAGENEKIVGLQPVIAATSFFEQSGLKGGHDLELYGVNLSAEASTERLNGWVTVPLQWTTYASSTFMTYGVDVGAKYELIRDSGLYLGAHGNYLANTGDGSFEDYNMAAGPLLSYTYKINQRFSISGGLLADYIHPQTLEDTWIGAVGVNLGVRLSQHMALNAYYSYWRDLGNDNVFLGTDWHEVGLDFAYKLGSSWRVVLGCKTTLAYAGYDYDYELHAGVGSQF